MFSKRRKIVALIDLENISKADDVLLKGKVVDFEKLHEFLLEFGELIFAFVFMPDHYVYSQSENIDLLGYTIIIPQKLKESFSDKLEDTADIKIIQTGMKFLEFEEITDVVVISNDKHMVHLIKEAKNRKKNVHLFGSEQISRVLKQVADSKNIHSLPLKNE